MAAFEKQVEQRSCAMSANWRAAVRRLFSDKKTRVSISDAARIAAESSAERVLSDICSTLMDALSRSVEKQ